MAESVKPIEGVAYTSNSFDDLFVALLAAVGYNPATMAPFRYNPWGRNGLAVTGASSPIAVASGDALVNGKLYTNSASKNINVATPSGATRIDRVVLRLDYTADPMTCEAVLSTGAEGGSAPALTQTDGTTWEVSLAQVSITTGGVITVTDERVMVGDAGITAYALAAAVAGNGLAGGAGTALSVTVDDSTIEINSDTLRVKDGGITPAKIADRTRYTWVPAIAGLNITDGTGLDGLLYTPQYGWHMVDSKKTFLYGGFAVPQDFSSGMTVSPVVVSVSSGNLYAYGRAQYGAINEAQNTHTATENVAAVALAGSAKRVLGHAALSLSSVALGDIVSLEFYRDATNAADTLSETVYFVGWLVSYTADS